MGPGWPGPGYRGQRPSKPFPSRPAVRRARVSVGGSLLLAHARPLIPGLHLITGPAGRSFYSSSVNAVAMDGSLTPGAQELQRKSHGLASLCPAPIPWWIPTLSASLVHGWRKPDPGPVCEHLDTFQIPPLPMSHSRATIIKGLKHVCNPLAPQPMHHWC